MTRELSLEYPARGPVGAVWATCGGILNRTRALPPTSRPGRRTEGRKGAKGARDPFVPSLIAHLVWPIPSATVRARKFSYLR
jgi:hypothetical protein